MRNGNVLARWPGYLLQLIYSDRYTALIFTIKMSIKYTFQYSLQRQKVLTAGVNSGRQRRALTVGGVVSQSNC